MVFPFAFWITCFVQYQVLFLSLVIVNNLSIGHIFMGVTCKNCLYLIPAWIAVNQDRLVVSLFVLFLVSLSLASASPRQVLASVLDNLCVKHRVEWKLHFYENQALASLLYKQNPISFLPPKLFHMAVLRVLVVKLVW